MAAAWGRVGRGHRHTHTHTHTGLLVCAGPTPRVQGAHAGSTLGRPGLGCTNLAPQWPCSQHPLTVCAGQVPPEDDEYEDSEYPVEEYQDPEAPWDDDGEEGGWAQRGVGRGRPSTSQLTSPPPPPLPPDPCSLPLDEGSCSAYTLRWYHRAGAGGTKACHPFVYGGCGGNANRFGTREACEHRCLPQAAHSQGTGTSVPPIPVGACTDYVQGQDLGLEAAPPPPRLGDLGQTPPQTKELIEKPNSGWSPQYGTPRCPLP